MRKVFLPLFFLAASVAAQPGHGPISGGGSGGSGAATSVQGSATLPATCTEKDLYQDTDSGGTEFYVCTATDTWTKTGTGTGDVVGPGSATDNAIARFDGTTGKLLQNTASAVIADNGGIYVPEWYGGGTTAATAEIVGDASFVYLGSGVGLGWSSAATPDGSSYVLDTKFVRAAAGIAKLTSALHLDPLASPPRTCDATAEGDIYSDTSHALCWCDGTTWQKLSGAGSCA